MTPEFIPKETSATPNSSSTNMVLIAGGIILLCLAGLCCLVIVAGILYFQIQGKATTGPLPEIPALLQTATTAPTFPSQSTLDPEAAPLYGTTSLQRGFLPDPFSFPIQAGGSVDTSALGHRCGFTTSIPSFTFSLRGGASETFLRIYFTALDGTDTTLLVYTPNQEWKCADNFASGGQVNPVLDFDFAPSGTYAIWAGTKLRGTIAAGTIYITGSQSISP
jgi:hypothetical protein